tara:strand:+ start:185 stop:676 length:492 start_codon:yes stop_codon:yes gene_type:complete
MLNISKKNFLITTFLTFFIFILDRLTKLYVVNFSEKNYSNEIFSSKYLNINLTWNEGIAFGLFSFDDKYFYNILTFLIGIVIIIIIFMIRKNKNFKRISLIMILGGALGNFYDRIFFNAVPDFIDFHIGNYHWFVFNVSDIFITLGVIFMIILEFIDNNKYAK